MKQIFLLLLGFIQAAIYFPINIFVTLVAYALSPILPLFADSNGWLPSCLWWFQTPDASIDGDSGWQNTTRHPFVNKLPRYFRRVLWLIRNPSYGFNCTVLATKPLPEGFISYGNLKISDKGVWGANFAYVKNTQYFVVRAYCPTIFGKCLKFRFGWNLATALDSNQYVGERIKYVFTCNPLKSIQ